MEFRVSLGVLSPPADNCGSHQFAPKTVLEMPGHVSCFGDKFWGVTSIPQEAQSIDDFSVGDRVLVRKFMKGTVTGLPEAQQ